MKNVILALFIVCTLTLCACGGSNKPTSSEPTETTTVSENSETTTNETTTEETAAIIEYKLGDMISTDTTDFTLEKATFTIACENANGEDYLIPVEYEAGTQNPFVAAVGETLVALTFTITNNNRTSSSIAEGSFSSDKTDWCFDWSVEYEDQTYHLYGQDTNDNYLQFRHAFLCENGSEWKKSDSDNKILGPGETLTVRTFGRIDSDVKVLDDEFKLIINVPSSQGYEQYTYVID